MFFREGEEGNSVSAFSSVARPLTCSVASNDAVRSMQPRPGRAEAIYVPLNLLACDALRGLSGAR